MIADANPPAGASARLQRAPAASAAVRARAALARSRSLLGGPRPAVAGVLAVALGLRLWGIDHGLPFVFNIDERAHFVPRAVAMFGGGLNPHDFLNPAALMYLLHGVLWAWFAGGHAVVRAYAAHPTEVFLVARVVSVLLGTLAVGLLYATGARMLDRRTGLLAAALLAVAFLPVFYSHQAVNDVPALPGVVLALLAAGRIALGEGGAGAYALAGLGTGLAAGTKYTAVMVLIAVLGAALAHARRERGAAARGALAAVAVAAVTFLVTNPYALLDHHAFLLGLRAQSEYNSRGLLLGERQDSGVLYYLWSLTWGLGMVPTLLVPVGAALLARSRPRLALVLVPAPVAFLLFMGLHGRYFARYLLPAYPFACLLAAHGALALAGLAARGRPRALAAAAVVAAVAVLGQAAVYTVHGDLVLARDNTLTSTRAWMVAHIPAGTRVVQEPIAPREWQNDGGRPGGRRRWTRFTRSPAVIRRLSRSFPGAAFKADFQNYERTLFPGMVALYRREGFCWVITGSTQEGRATLQPRRVPEAPAYYAELRRSSRVAYSISPLAGGGTPTFQFDWSFDSYPLSYVRPGPAVTVYRLDGCRPR